MYNKTYVRIYVHVMLCPCVALTLFYIIARLNFMHFQNIIYYTSKYKIVG
jgi:hypothetical protein